LQWAGGFTSQHEVIRTVFRYAQQADFGRLKERVQSLHSAGNSLQQIADVLNREGFRPVKPVDQFDKEMVAHILAQYILPPSKQRRRSVGARLEKHEWLVRDLAKKLNVSKTNLHRWIKLGWIHSRRLPGLQGTVICWADAEELKRLRKLRHARHGWWDPPWPPDLTTPKPRPKG
jgi:DNA-binding transcriptional MerR regulator